MRRLRTRAQFQAVLACRPIAWTPHFALHYLALDAASNPQVACLFESDPDWLGALVPKRWARRAVRRNALRRQIHALGDTQVLAGGAFLIRLRAAFARSAYPSATSAALKRAVGAELRQLLDRRPA